MKRKNCQKEQWWWKWINALMNMMLTLLKNSKTEVNRREQVWQWEPGRHRENGKTWYEQKYLEKEPEEMRRIDNRGWVMLYEHFQNLLPAHFQIFRFTGIMWYAWGQENKQIVKNSVWTVSDHKIKSCHLILILTCLTMPAARCWIYFCVSCQKFSASWTMS